MKINLLRLIVLYSKRTLKYFLLQLLVMQVVLAEPSSSQSMEDYKVSLRATNQRLIQVLAELEKQTDFVFAYNQEVTRDRSRITLTLSSDLKSILQKITEQVDYDFKRVNENIYVVRSEASEINPATKEVEEEVTFERREIDIRGKVTDERGEPIPGATVVVEGSTIGTVTDIDGQFALNVGEGAVLRISFIGYTAQRVTVSNQSTINVVLKEDQSSLEEVVVVGYGTQEKRNITGAISSLDEKSIREIPVASAVEAMQGQVAGVDIVSSGGRPGQNPQILIRGRRSISASNEPLYVIDGIPQTSESSSIFDINPQDITSMASAASRVLKKYCIP